MAQLFEEISQLIILILMSLVIIIFTLKIVLTIIWGQKEGRQKFEDFTQEIINKIRGK